MATHSAEIRARLDHPVIDSDGHTVEFLPAVLDYLKRIAGSEVVERYARGGLGGGPFGWYGLSREERFERRATRPPWWALPARNTLDRATASLPKLLRERLEDMGIDFTVLYPTLGLFAIMIPDEEPRRAVCRAINACHADLFQEQADRMTPAAIVPMQTPEEAIEELEYAAGDLGMKAIMMAGLVVRKIPSAQDATWVDTFGVDSQYDYDPVWAKCVELGVCPTFHSGGMGWGARTSISNYMYNHIGHFAAAGEATCKSLFMGGVTRRFPTLKFAFLECGVGWACSLYADLIGHWEKRNREHLSHYDPKNVDVELLVELFERYPEKAYEGKLDALRGGRLLGGTREDPELLDEWAACGIEKAENIRDLFVPRFYFGCEADDPANAFAFNTRVNPFGARLRAIFSSDIGHWDVPDMTRVTAEAHELVERGILSDADFREFVFTNPAEFWTALNPDFFKGTAVENAVAGLRTAG